MDAYLESVTMEFPVSSVDHSDLPAACALCQRILSSDNGAGDLESISICGDCKFLLLEDNGTPSQDIQRRRTSRARQTRYNSSESVETIFSQQFANIINLARQNQPPVFEQENQSFDNSDAAARLVQRTSSRTTPSGSRRWRRGMSDTESDGGFDSIYGESESNVSFSGYRHFHGESDAISFSAYGGDSDASVDGNSFLDNDMFIHPDGGSDLDSGSDTDIDPMHAGLNQWNSDDQDDEEDEWEEVDAEENTLGSLVAGVRLHRSLTSNRSNIPVHWHRRVHSPEFEGTIHLRIGERTEAPFTNIFANLEELDVPPYAGNSGDYLDARGFEELLERLAETDSSRRGAPPAAVSFVKSLDRVVINEEHEKQDDLACAICKESLSVGTVVNQLPCFHLYHPSCIVPWLSARNSCPLCRYELPTDDKDYESRKQSNSAGLVIHEIQQQGRNEDSSSETSDGGEADEACETINGQIESSRRESRRGRWLFLAAAAAPIVSLVGIALVLWLGNPLTETRGRFGQGGISVPGQQSIQSPVSMPPNQRENRSRRWWSLF